MRVSLNDRGQIHKAIFWLTSCLIAFSLPLPRGLSVTFTVILIGNWISTPGIAERLRSLHKEPAFLILSSLFFAALLGMLYTRDISEGLFYIQNWSLILIFPLVYSTSTLIDTKMIRWVLVSFLLGCLAASTYALAIKTLEVAASPDGLKSFFNYTNAYTNFTDLINLHPAYYSMYLVFSICILGYYTHYREKGVMSVALSSAVFSLLLFCILYAASRNQIAQAIVIVNLLAFLFIGSLSVIKRAVLIIGINILVALLIMNMTYSKQRFELIWNPKPSVTDNRYDRWLAGFEIIQSHPILGVGTGDHVKKLLTVYEKNNLTNALQHKYNLHNGFLEATVQLGLVGGLLLVTSLFFPLFMSLKHNNYLYALFLFTLIVSLVTESMLDRQKGIFFYAFFNAFLCFQYSNRWSRNEKQVWLT